MASSVPTPNPLKTPVCAVMLSTKEVVAREVRGKYSLREKTEKGREA